MDIPSDAEHIRSSDNDAAGRGPPANSHCTLLLSDRRGHPDGNSHATFYVFSLATQSGGRAGRDRRCSDAPGEAGQLLVPRLGPGKTCSWFRRLWLFGLLEYEPCHCRVCDIVGVRHWLGGEVISIYLGLKRVGFRRWLEATAPPRGWIRPFPSLGR